MNPYNPPEPSEDFPSFMKGKIDVKCPHCKHEFSSPANRGYRITYWIILISAIAYFIFSRSQGKPSIFILMMSFAVLADICLMWLRK